MKTLSFFCRLLLAASALCFTLPTLTVAAEAGKSAPASAATGKKEPAAQKAAAPAKKPAAPAKKAASAPKATAGKKAPAQKSSPNSPEALQKGLDDFAHKTIATLNRVVIPSIGKKEINKGQDGNFTARYIEIDPKSIRTSYKKPDRPGPVAYVGYMSYTEIEYQCTASTRAEAAKGPFKPKNSKMLTELIKHVNGKWTY